LTCDGRVVPVEKPADDINRNLDFVVLPAQRVTPPELTVHLLFQVSEDSRVGAEFVAKKGLVELLFRILAYGENSL